MLPLSPPQVGGVLLGVRLPTDWLPVDRIEPTNSKSIDTIGLREFLVQMAICPAGSTVKLTVDTPVPAMVVTETVPVVAPLGTVTVSDVVVAAVTVAGVRVPLN